MIRACRAYQARYFLTRYVCGRAYETMYDNSTAWDQRHKPILPLPPLLTSQWREPAGARGQSRSESFACFRTLYAEKLLSNRSGRIATAKTCLHPMQVSAVRYLMGQQALTSAESSTGQRRRRPVTEAPSAICEANRAVACHAKLRFCVCFVFACIWCKVPRGRRRSVKVHIKGFQGC